MAGITLSSTTAYHHVNCCSLPIAKSKAAVDGAWLQGWAHAALGIATVDTLVVEWMVHSTKSELREAGVSRRGRCKDIIIL